VRRWLFRLVSGSNHVNLEEVARVFSQTCQGQPLEFRANLSDVEAATLNELFSKAGIPANLFNLVKTET